MVIEVSRADLGFLAPSTKTKKRKTVKAAEQETRRRRTVPEDACPTCGVMMKPTIGTYRHRLNGEPVPVARTSYRRCPRCHELVISLQELMRVERESIAIYRERHHLLAADEIRELRARLGVTQSQLAKLLHLGANTVSRWEAGRNVQTAAMDILLRLLRDVPGSLAYLRKHAA
jgi:putative zinc finger/helix-turn-helix YgiT family protein